MAVMFTFALSSLVVTAVALGVTPKDDVAEPMRQALAWGIADGCITTSWIFISIIPAMLPSYFALPIVFEAIFSIFLPSIHIAVTVISKRQLSRSCSGNEVEGACSVMKTYLWPLMVFLTIISLIYVLVLAFVIDFNRGEGYDLVIGDLYILDWKPSLGEHSSEWPGSPGSFDHDYKSKKISPNMIRRVDYPEKAEDLWGGFDDVELGLDPSPHGDHPSMVPDDRSTTYGGKIPVNGYQHDQRPAWAKRLSIIRGKQAPFPTKAVQLLVKAPSPAHTVEKRASFIDLPGMRQFPNDPPMAPEPPSPDEWSHSMEQGHQPYPTYLEKSSHLAVPTFQLQASYSTFPSVYSVASANRSQVGDNRWWPFGQRPTSMARSGRTKSMKSGRSLPQSRLR